MNATRGLGICCLLIASCAHTHEAQPAPEPAAKPTTVLARTTQAQVPAPAVAPESNDPEHPDRIEAFMLEHFAIVTWARDCVISANLEALRDPVRALAKYEYRTVAPGGWMPFVADLQEAAQLTSNAENLDLAATGVATMARVCGDCHRQKAPGAKFDPPQPEAKRTKRDSFDQRMQRHIWAADRMWAGLTEPSDEAWSAGAAALAALPETAPPSVDPEVAAALREVRELGTRALDASSPRDRADVYGLLISTCANCHAHVVVSTAERTRAL